MNFSLRGLSSEDLLELPRNEKLASLLPEELRRFSPWVSAPPPFRVPEESPSEDLYFRKSSRGEKTLLATSNCSVFRLCCLGETFPTRCSWCRKGDLRKEDVIGVPVTGHSIKIEGKNTIVYDRPCCGFRCMYALFLQERNFLTHESGEVKNLILCLFDLCYPGKRLRPAPDWTLHKRNGGSLNDEQFNSDIFSYRRTDSVVVQPGKRVFIVEHV